MAELPIETPEAGTVRVVATIDLGAWKEDRLDRLESATLRLKDHIDELLKFSEDTKVGTNRWPSRWQEPAAIPKSILDGLLDVARTYRELEAGEDSEGGGNVANDGNGGRGGAGPA